MPPAVIVHDAAHVRAAMALGLPFVALSPPGFALYAGCLWWQAILDESGFSGDALLDCADAPGRAVEAMRMGLRGVVLDGACLSFERVSLIAGECGAILLDKAPPALDLARRGADRRLAAWLGAGGEFR